MNCVLSRQFAPQITFARGFAPGPHAHWRMPRPPPLAEYGNLRSAPVFRLGTLNVARKEHVLEPVPKSSNCEVINPLLLLSGWNLLTRKRL